MRQVRSNLMTFTVAASKKRKGNCQCRLSCNVKSETSPH